MASKVPGEMIEARCTRCNDITGHVIVVVVGGEIIKVECRACGSVHKYYPPAAQKKSATRKEVCRVKPGEDRKSAVDVAGKVASRSTSAPSSTAAKTVRKAPSPKIRKDALEIEEAWQRSINTNVAAPRPYAMDAVFAAGDVMEHSVFGLGVVQEVQPPNKVAVLFRDGVKLLRCAG